LNITHHSSHDLTSMWVGLNEWFLGPEADRECIPQGMRLVSGPLTLSTNTSECDIDLARLGYKKQKWSKLTAAYIDPVEVALFKLRWERRKKMPVYSVSMAFRRREDNINGSCLNNLTLTTLQGKLIADWSIRASEVASRFGADIAFFNRLLGYLGFDPAEVSSNLHISLAFSAAVFSGLFLVYQGVDPAEELEDATWLRDQISTMWRKKIKSSRVVKYGPIRRIRQRLEDIEGGFAKPMPVAGLKIIIPEVEDNEVIRKLRRSIRRAEEGPEGDGGDDAE